MKYKNGRVDSSESMPILLNPIALRKAVLSAIGLT